MLSIICSIPENVGWIAVGAAATFAIGMAVQLIKILVCAWIDNHSEEEEEE